MPLFHHLTGWLLDAYPVHVGMAVWFLADNGVRHRLIDPYAPAFYLAGTSAGFTQATRLLTQHHIVHRHGMVQRRELWDADTIPVCEVVIIHPTQFQQAVKLVMESVPHLRLYQADVALPQLYFYDRRLFPLCRCDADVASGAGVLAIRACDSPWTTDYSLPPLSIMELMVEGASPNPNHGGVFQLLVRVEGRERYLEGEDTAEFVQTVNGLLQRHDPDILLTDWGGLLHPASTDTSRDARAGAVGPQSRSHTADHGSISPVLFLLWQSARPGRCANALRAAASRSP
jgi:hypothetical protein